MITAKLLEETQVYKMENINTITLLSTFWEKHVERNEKNECTIVQKLREDGQDHDCQ